MDHSIVLAIWEGCPDLSEPARSLLQALVFHCHHGDTCFPSVKTLARFIRRKHRQTQKLLRDLEKKGYITVRVGRGRGHSTRYTINTQTILHRAENMHSEMHLSENMHSRVHLSEKTCTLECTSKHALQSAPKLLWEEEKTQNHPRAREETLLKRLGLTPGSDAWKAALNGHLKHAVHKE
jgi:hypothetical protein